MSRYEGRLRQANEILNCYAPHVTLERRKGRLWLQYRSPHGGRWECAKAAVLNSSGCSLGCNYGALSMGGTCAQATAQLVRWLRNDTRLPLDTWRYWNSPTVALGREHGPRMLDLLQASDYDDPRKTACVLCGNPRIGDWWSLDGVVGPCCDYRSGCRQGVAP